MPNKYGFLFKKSSLPKANLNALLSMDDFVRAADEINAEGKGIEDIDIYNIAKTLYFPKRYAGERSGNALQLYKAVRRFSIVLFGSEDRWKTDFEEYIQELN